MSFENCLNNAEMLAPEERAIREALVRMIQHTTSNAALRDDLLQEALVHLWLIQTRRPGQTRSWYLQSCKFHLQHYLTSGRSVDSAKRRAGQLPWNSNAEDENGFSDGANTENSVLAWVSARDIIALLSRHLLASEKAVLNCLADGLGPREISHRLRISHTMVIKHRRRIAALLTRLETANISLAPIPRVNGVTHRAAISPDNGDKSGGKLGQRE